MRPERLVMEGFAPFRERVEVEFDDLELFALTGPTGAGKSSVIDAIVFALYGSVPRHGKKSVGPIISLGRASTAVSLEFEVEGTAYTVARKVQRHKRGGVGSEARLESGGDVLASGSEVTPAVEALLGLGIDHFTRSVVLPQGEFAAFLHDTPAGQQDLVKALLDMGMLDTVRRLSAERSKMASGLAEQARVAVDRLADATPEVVEVGAGRVAALEKLAEPVAAAEEAIAESEALATERSKAVATLEEEDRLLRAVAVPEGVAELAEAVTQRGQALAAARDDVARADTTLKELEAAGEGLPSRNDLEAIRDTAERLAAACDRRDRLDLSGLEKAAADAEREAGAAAERLEGAIGRLEEVRERHAAHALAAGLEPGDACPVCERPLDRAPDLALPDLDEKQEAVTSARTASEAAEETRRAAATALVEARAAHQAADQSATELQERLEALPDVDDLDEVTEARRELDENLAAARSRVQESRAGVERAEALLAELEEATARAWRQFGDIRDRLAGMEPPPPPRDDLQKAWEELCEWAAGRAELVGERLVEAKAAADTATAAVDKQRSELSQLLADAGVEGTGPASARLAAATATARAALERAEERLSERRALEADLQRFSAEASVASSLNNHLKANKFEGWLLSEALATLVEGANDLLADLTSGNYSLTLSEREIEVVDHRNADELRSVRSLSGGETFLVSLALALSLGEQLATVSDRGSARLEAIFLDEGFGSLDSETLETVTVVVSELAARGRMVGVVTHVKDLADQMPVRFEVRPGPDGSTIDRVAV